MLTHLPFVKGVVTFFIINIIYTIKEFIVHQKKIYKNNKNAVRETISNTLIRYNSTFYYHYKFYRLRTCPGQLHFHVLENLSYFSKRLCEKCDGLTNIIARFLKKTLQMWVSVLVFLGLLSLKVWRDKNKGQFKFVYSTCLVEFYKIFKLCKMQTN